MNQKRKKLQVYLAAAMLITTYLLGGCSNDHEESYEAPTEWKLQTFRVIPKAIDGSEVKTDITSLDAYLFIKDKLQKVFKDLSVGSNNQCAFEAVEGSTVYFIANLPQTDALRTLEVGKTDVSTFLSLRTEAADQDKALLFFSGLTQISALAGSNPTPVDIPLLRSVAQLDLDTSRDDKIKVTRIVVDGASATTSLFPAGSSSTSSATKATYDLVYNPAISSTENILQMYESRTPIAITVYATYQDIPTVINLSMPEVKRNYKYTIELKGIGSTITGNLQIIPWENGGTVGADPDQTGKIYLNKSLSSLPEGADMDEANGSISVSENGGELTLAFTSDMQIELASADGLGDNVTIAPTTTESKDGKVTSLFRVKVNKQGKGRLGYQVILHMKRSLQQFSYDDFYINVDKSSHQIAETTIGGVTWMAFNATTRNLDDQIYTLDGESVEKAYQLRWGGVIGGLFQWGRIYQYTPWLSGTNNAGGQNQNTPWTADTHVPCPEGYRLPTKAEMRALLPPNQTIPGEYKYNGETIKAEIRSAVPETVTLGNVTGKARYLSLTSNTGAVLYIPLSGQKGDKSGTNNPGFGQGFTIWTSERGGAISGWAWSGNYWPGNGTTAVIPANSQLQAEAYAYVRCLKEKKQ